MTLVEDWHIKFYPIFIDKTLSTYEPTHRQTNTFCDICKTLGSSRP